LESEGYDTAEDKDILVMFGVGAKLAKDHDAREWGRVKLFKNNGRDEEGRRLLLGIYTSVTECNIY